MSRNSLLTFGVSSVALKAMAHFVEDQFFYSTPQGGPLLSDKHKFHTNIKSSTDKTKMINT